MPGSDHNKLRLLLTTDCNRKCRGCCNKDYDLDSLPTCRDYSGYKTIMITGGEPLLYPDKIKACVDVIRKQNEDSKIIIYTAMLDDYDKLMNVLNLVDGVTLTLHTRKDIPKFNRLMQKHSWSLIKLSVTKSLRLNVFHNISVEDLALSQIWQTKAGMQWIKNCPLPVGEVFMKYAEA